jgi:nucleotide-binding universal stress UspA family protein
MNPYRHILCPVDFSDASRAALHWASRFSKEVAARLSVLHVLDTALLNVGNLVAAPDILAELRRRAEEAFASLKREPELAGAGFRIAEGSPADAIVEASNKEGVELLVMGTHGVSGFQKFFLGSVTERVLHRARVPLLTISPAVEERRTLNHGNHEESRGPKKILMAIDLGPESQSVVRHGVWLAEHYRARLIALHVVSHPYVVVNEVSFEPLTGMELQRLTEPIVAERRKQVEALLPETSGVAVDILLTVGSPFESLRGVLNERSADLVVMGAGGHGEAGIRWMGSTCHKMVRSAPCPVLIVR